MRYRILTRVAIAVLGALGCARDAFAGSDLAPPELEVHMPDYVVEGDRPLPPPESWRYVSVPAIELTRGERVVVAPGFEILSNLSVQNTRLLVKELQRRQLVGAVLWPALVKGSPFEPLAVVIDLDLQAARMSATPTETAVHQAMDGATLNWAGDPIASLYGVGQAPGDSFGWIFAPQGELILPPEARTGSRELATTRSSNVEVWGESPNRVAEVSAGSLWAGAKRPSEEWLAAEISEQTALLALAALCERSKPWLKIGLGRLIATTQVSATEIEFAGVPVLMGSRHIPDLRVVLTKESGLTVEERDFGSAFVHYGLYGRNAKYASRFIELVERLETEPLSDRLMKETMGRSLRRMDAEVRGFVRSLAYFRSVKFRGRLPEMLPTEVREATQAEVARLQAKLAMGKERPDLALDGLRVAYRRGEREPAMLALLAHLEASYGSLDRAQRIVAALIEAPHPPRGVFVLAGRIRLQEFTADDSRRRLDARETSAVIEPLERGIRVGQGTEELWTFLAEIVQRSSARPHASVAELLDEAVKRYPQNVTIWKAAEVARARSGRDDADTRAP